MKSILIALKSHTKSYTKKLHSKVHIFPSILEKKSTFTKEEKAELTKKGVRWYVYFDYRDPSTNKMVRQTPVSNSINRDCPDFDERFFEVHNLKRSVEEMLKDGWSPYRNGKGDQEAYSCESSIKFAMEILESSCEKSTYRDYKYRVGQFTDFLKRKGLLYHEVSCIDRPVINQFLNETLHKTSPRNRNNHRTALSAVFNVLEADEIIPLNFIRNIRKLKAKPVRNRPFSPQQVDKITKHLKANDPHLLNFITMVSYNFLRPIEVVRLRCKDVDLQNRLLYVKAKNKPEKTKLIPDALISQLSKMNLSNSDHFLFTPEGVPGEWETEEVNKRNYYSSRFAELKKSLKLGVEFNVYSFRHYYTLQLYKALRKKYHTSETLDRLMLITGHESVSGLKNYLRTIDAEMPEDWSDML